MLIPHTFLFRLHVTNQEAFEQLIERLNARPEVGGRIDFEPLADADVVVDGFMMLQVSVPDVLTAESLTAEWAKLRQG